MKKTRQSNMELLRILAICGVIVMHYNGGSCSALEHVVPDSFNHWLLLALEGLFICGVDVFILISGYYSCTSQHRDPLKAISLLVQVIAFNVAFHLLNVLRTGSFSFSAFLTALLPANYFVVLYVALYLLSPYINLALKKLSVLQLRNLTLLLVGLLSLWPTLADLAGALRGRDFMGLNPVSAYGDSWGYTLVNFVLMYVIGAYLRLAEIRVKKLYTLPVLFALTALLAITGKLDNGHGIAWSYCNPLVVAQAVTVFLFFRQLSLESKIINALATCTFTCFLFHGYILPMWDAAVAVTRSPLWLLAHIIGAVVIIYSVSWVIDKLYHLVTDPLLKLAGKLSFLGNICIEDDKDKR